MHRSHLLGQTSILGLIILNAASSAVPVAMVCRIVRMLMEFSLHPAGGVKGQRPPNAKGLAAGLKSQNWIK